MRPVSVTDEEVISAGNELLKKGITVNGFQLRKAIGAGQQKRLFDVWLQYVELTPSLNNQQDSEDDCIPSQTSSTFATDTLGRIEPILLEAFSSLLTSEQNHFNELLKAQHQTAKEQNERYEHDIAERDEYSSGLEEEIKDLGHELEKKEQEVVSINALMAKLENNLNGKELELIKVVETNNSLRKLVDEKTDQMNQLNDQLNNKELELNNKSISIATLTERNESLNSSIKQLKDDIKSKGNDLIKVQAENQLLLTKTGTLEGENKTLTSNLSALKAEHQDLDQRHKQLLIEKDRLDIQLSNRIHFTSDEVLALEFSIDQFNDMIEGGSSESVKHEKIISDIKSLLKRFKAE
ncbi:hypothetical protein HWA77_17030 [Photobacterium damselae subsp. damselae]|uniref:KfrA N-terminal DNA-binding domain-containing protein n=1 Tax=Photobacterium damselae subsp. damselae TaxID=85581 RepID=A0A850R4K1_PHODD|nr:hypothetical protein [Photobacterium damselae subsp. damselae]